MPPKPAPVVSFTVRRDLTSAERDDLVSKIQALDGVAAAGWLVPDSTRPAIRRMGHVRLRDGADPAPVLEALHAMPDIESASLAARRYTI